jgi:hypothetical protein
MATSYVSFNEGSARKVRTFQRTDGANTVEEWLYSLSEPVLDAYTLVATGIAGVTADSHLLQIMAGASLRVGIRRITIFQEAAANTTRQVKFEMRRLTSAGTGGGAITPRALDPASAAAGATGMTLPTGKGTESATGLMDRYISSVSTTVTGLLVPVLDADYGNEREKALWIAAGASNGICIKNITADSAVTYSIAVRIVEASWA